MIGSKFDRLRNLFVSHLPIGLRKIMDAQKSSIYALFRKKKNISFHASAYENNPKFYGGRSKIKTILMDQLPSYIYENKDVLDIGCGQGQDGFALAKEGSHVVGIDREQTAIKQINQDDEELTGSFEGIKSDVTDFYIKQDTYDMIISNHALQYLNSDTFISTIKRIQQGTKSGGYNILSLPSESNIRSFKTMFDEKKLTELYNENREIIYIETSDSVYKDNSRGRKVDLIVRKK